MSGRNPTPQEVPPKRRRMTGPDIPHNPNAMIYWDAIGCTVGHDTHATRIVDVDLADEHGYYDLPPVPRRLRQAWRMHVYEWDLYRGSTYCPGRDVVSETIATQCQPAGTMVRLTRPDPGNGPGNWWAQHDVPIEDVKVGDVVMSWVAKGFYRRKGKPVTEIAVRPYEGRLIVAAAGGRESRYTADHRVIVRLGQRPGAHVVYMQRQGDRYRIGSTQWTYASQQFGPRCRAVHEGADAFWVLSVHDSLGEARLHEMLTCARFGIPGARFARGLGASEPFSLDAFWSKLGPNRVAAEACLRHFGRLIDSPLMEKADPVEGDYAKWSRGKTMKGAIATAASNLIEGMTVCVEDGSYGGTWESVSLREEWHSGPVFSLNVADDHTYVADGIATHNCIWEPRETILAAQVLSTAQPGQIMLDLGAQVGWFSLLAATWDVPAVAFDADPENLRVLHESIDLNHFTVPILTALERIGPDTAPIDLDHLNATSIRFAKIDLEGAEDDAIRILEPLLADGLVDHMMVEVSPCFADYYGELVVHLIELGYEAYRLPDKRPDPRPLDDPDADLAATRLDTLGLPGVKHLIDHLFQEDVWFRRVGATW